MQRDLALFRHELQSILRWALGWIFGLNAYVIITVAIYPGESALYDMLSFFQSEEYFQAFLGNIGGDAPAYRIWVALLFPFMAVAFFIFALMLGTKITTNAISNETGELLHPQPLRREELLTIRFLVAVVVIILNLIVTAILLRIPFAGEAISVNLIWDLSWWAFLFLIAITALGMIFGLMAADTGRGNLFTLMIALVCYGLQISGRIFTQLADINKLNPLTWYAPEQVLLGRDIADGTMTKILLLLVLALGVSYLLFAKRDLIREASINIPLLTAFQRGRGGGRQRSDRDRLMVRWARPLEQKLPFTADFIYSEYRVLLVVFWAIVIFYPVQLMAYKPNDPVFIRGLEETIKSFGSSGFLRIFTYGHDMGGQPFLWFLITQAIGNHYFLGVPLAAHWIKKILVADSENLTGECYGAIAIPQRQVVFQRFLAVALELGLIVLQMVGWLLLSEWVVGTSYNQPWEVITIICIIPLYVFLVAGGLALGLVLDAGVRYARLVLLVLILWFVTGIFLNGSTGFFGLYDPVLILENQSLLVADGGMIWITALAVIACALIIRLANRFQWLRITTRTPSSLDKETTDTLHQWQGSEKYGVQ